MAASLQVIAAGASQAALLQVQSALEAQTDIHLSLTTLVGTGHTDPLRAIQEAPDLFILVLGANWETELNALGTQAAISLPPLVVIAPEADPAIIRFAMRAGARDFLVLPVQPEDLVACVRRVAQQRRPTVTTRSVTAVINAKGGSGASFVAGNLAHALAQGWGRSVALLDQDLQFGAQDLCLNVKPRGSLLEAIHMSEQLDAQALAGYMSKHASGVHLLGSYTDELPLHWEVSPAKLGSLLRLAADSYDHLIIDLPRQIDPLTTTVFEFADSIFVVMQQTLLNIRDTRKILAMLVRDLGVPPAHIRVIVNHHENAAPVTLGDIQGALKIDDLLIIPRDDRRATKATNLGVPIHTNSPNAPIVKAFLDLAGRITGASPEKRRGGLRGALAGMFGPAPESKR